MIKQVVFAIGADAFEKNIIDYLNTEDGENSYVLAHSATHLDGLQDVCARLRPQILVIREGLGEQKVDFLELVRNLKMTITGLRIIVLARSRQPGDPFLTGLVLYQIYDFIATGKMSVESVGNLILSPHTIQDVANYVPEVNLEQNGTQFSFASPGMQVEGENSPVHQDSGVPLQDISETYRSVNHVSTLGEIDAHEGETSLFTEKQNKVNGYMDVGSKLSYNPLFQPVVKKQEEHRPVRTRDSKTSPRLFSDDDQQLSLSHSSDESVTIGNKPYATNKVNPQASPIQKKKTVLSDVGTQVHEKENEKAYERPVTQPLERQVKEVQQKGFYNRKMQPDIDTKKDIIETPMRPIDAKGMFALYEGEELYQQLDLFKTVLSRVTMKAIENPLDSNDEALSVLKSLFKEATIEKSKRPEHRSFSEGEHSVQSQTPLPKQKVAYTTERVPYKEESRIELSVPPHSAANSSNVSGTVTKEPDSQDATYTAASALASDFAPKKSDSGSSSLEDVFERAVKAKLEESAPMRVQVPKPELSPDAPKKSLEEPDLPQTSPEHSENVDERLKRLSALRRPVDDSALTNVSEHGFGISQAENGQRDAVEMPIVSAVEKSEERQGNALALTKKTVAFLTDSTNANMVAFNMFADMALHGDKCVYVRFKQVDAENFQFDTLLDKGCQVEMLDNPNAYEIKDRMEDKTVNHVIFNIPCDLDFRFTQRLLEDCDCIVLDIDQNCQRVVEHASQYKSLLNGLRYVVMVAGYNSSDSNQSVEKLLRCFRSDAEVAAIDTETMKERQGDDPYALLHPKQFAQKCEDLYQKLESL